jgi:heat shock protein HtpX
MDKSRISFHDQISSNKWKSFLLISFIFIILIILGYFISFAFPKVDFFFIMTISVIISIGYILISYYNSDKIALMSVNAKEADPREYRQLYNTVEGLTLASGMPMPKVYVMHQEQINAFASGRDPKHSVICVTDGAIQKLNKQELEGVLGHELSHIANYDIRFMTITAVMVGMIAIISEIFLRSMWMKGNSRDDNKSGAVLMIIGLVLAILAPIVVQLVQLAISRRREYAADASSVKFIRSPTGLIGALKKIKNDNPMRVPKAVAPLFLSDPLKRRIEGLMSTHPPIDSRIKILERM